MKDYNNWDGKNYYKNLKLPSLNQIQQGLIAEAMVQLKLAIGNLHDQKAVFEAQSNILKTWEDLIGLAKV